MPARTAQDIPFAVITDLAAHPNLLGVKECTGNARIQVGNVAGLIEFIPRAFISELLFPGRQEVRLRADIGRVGALVALCCLSLLPGPSGREAVHW